MSALLLNYINGNTHVSLWKCGTKTFTTQDDEFKWDYPNNIDMKITNNCNLGCKYCHESSVEDGRHASIVSILKVLKDMPPIEIAIGGGNPLDFPALEKLLTELKSIGHVCNMTVNSMHVAEKRYLNILDNLVGKELVRGLGISISSSKKYWKLVNNVQCIGHVIAGVHDIELVKSALDHYGKILILGYKDYGFGTKYKSLMANNIQSKIDKFKSELSSLLESVGCNQTISFDNLAVKQLDVQSSVTEEFFKKHYLGNEGSQSFFYDAVENKYAVSSTHERKQIQSTILKHWKESHEANY